MPISRDRKPSLADLLTLVGATAIGLAAVKNAHGWYFEGWARWSGDRGWLISHMLGAAGMILGSWTLALLAIRLRKPRPRLRRLSRQPGFAACLSAAFGMGVVGLFTLAISPVTRNPGPPAIGMNTIALPGIGLAVAASWIVMATGGRWRPEPSWLDRAGRLLGALWLLALVSFWAAFASGVAHVNRVW